MKSVESTSPRPSCISLRSTSFNRPRSDRHYRSQARSQVRDISINPHHEDLQIYFSNAKRKTYIQKTVDQYFTQIPNPQKPANNSFILINPETPSNISLERHANSSQSAKRNLRTRRIDLVNFSRLKLQSKMMIMDMNSISTLPIIEEGLDASKRPFSEHRPHRSSKEKDIDSSLLYQNTKSFLDNSISLDNSVQNESPKKIISNRKSTISRICHKIYQQSDKQQLQRQLFAKKIGISVLWKQIDNKNTLQFGTHKTLKQMCYSLIEDRQGVQPIYIIHPQPYYYSLFVNQNQQLKDIIVYLAKNIVLGKGNVSNNQISLQNMVRKNQKQFYMSDWGAAGFYQQLQVQGRIFNRQLPPLLKRGNKWVVTPEYLAPQLLKAFQTNNTDQLWHQKGGISSCDIWSIGLLIFEIVTLIPITCSYYCAIKGKDQRKKGYFNSRLKTVDQIMRKQKNFKYHALRIIKEQMRIRKQIKIDDKILFLLPRMLQENVENRISAAQILERLK